MDKLLAQGLINKIRQVFASSWNPGWGGGVVLPYMGYIGTGMCGPKGYGFSAILVIDRVSILANFGHSCLDMGMFLRRSHFFIIIEKKINKSPSHLCLRSGRN